MEELQACQTDKDLEKSFFEKAFSLIHLQLKDRKHRCACKVPIEAFEGNQKPGEFPIHERTMTVEENINPFYIPPFLLIFKLIIKL